MKRLTHICLCFVLLLSGCAPVLIIDRRASIEKYRYAYIPQTGTTVSSSASYAVLFGWNVTSSVNPKDIISGVLINKGIIVIPELNPDLKEHTLIVNYAESQDYGGSITIQLISAANYEILYSATSQKMWYDDSQTDMIRNAILRAMNGLFPNNNNNSAQPKSYDFY